MSEKKATIQSNKGKEIDNKIPDKQEKTDKKEQNNSTTGKNDNQIEQTSKIEASKNENSQTNVNANNQDEKKPDPQNQQSVNIQEQNANNQDKENDKNNKTANENNANTGRKLNEDKNEAQTTDTKEKNNEQKEVPKKDDSFFKKHKLKFFIGFIISIFIIIALIVILIVVLIKTKKNEETEKNGKTEFLKNQETLNKEKLCNENCFQCDHSSEKCISCNSDFELYNGKCIQYAFSATYDFITVNYYPIKLFNSDKIDNLFAMKINYNIISPNHELYSYDYYGNNIIYYYLDDNNNNISLSYLFENIPELIEISFNDENINNFNITNMKGMFSGCTSLKNANFNSFKGQI